MEISGTANRILIYSANYSRSFRVDGIRIIIERTIP